MYDKRVKIFVAASGAMLLVCVLRLAQMQLLPGSSVQDEIARLKSQGSSSQQLKTLRGKILDRKGRILADDDARFELCISYSLCSILDANVPKAALARPKRMAEEAPENAALRKSCKDLETKLEAKRRELIAVIESCAQFGVEQDEIEKKIRAANDKIWRIRTFLAWLRNNPDRGIIAKYGKVSRVPFSEAVADFKNRFPSESKRLELTGQVRDLSDMKEFIPLLGLKTDDDVFNAQVEFLDVEGIEIVPTGHRFYPYGTAAAQTIGWVGPASQAEDLELFADDKLASYLGGEVCGKEDGVEYVCESILRGKRGELVYDIDSQLVSQTETKFGKDVYLTLDIELQKRIEEYLRDYDHDPNCGPGMAAAVIEVATGDILALVSLPLFDLNRVRDDYSELAASKLVNRRAYDPLVNRAINRQYPPGSVVKPVIFVAGAETGVITADEVISCPAHAAPEGWPNCWIYNTYKWMGHDSQWPDNKARNAIKGSCNIYFSHLADRVEPRALQQWLFNFGYGRSILEPPACIKRTEFERELRHSCGRISSGVPEGKIERFDQVPPLSQRERRWIGIGHGKFLVTPLQVANAMAAIARRGIYKNPQIFLDNPYDSSSPMRCPEGDVD
ncbi:MAG: hypothetical protein JXN61_04415, partial [Sedimentisphaerales bacterium]|nr:hypothetical protein [Sedimentisphaerales bacterium]